MTFSSTFFVHRAQGLQKYISQFQSGSLSKWEFLDSQSKQNNDTTNHNSNGDKETYMRCLISLHPHHYHHHHPRRAPNGKTNPVDGSPITSWYTLQTRCNKRNGLTRNEPKRVKICTILVSTRNSQVHMFKTLAFDSNWQQGQDCLRFAATYFILSGHLIIRYFWTLSMDMWSTNLNWIYCPFPRSSLPRHLLAFVWLYPLRKKEQ